MKMFFTSACPEKHGWGTHRSQYRTVYPVSVGWATDGVMVIDDSSGPELCAPALGA